MSRKIRIYPPIIVTALVLLVFAAAAVASIAAAEEQHADRQPPAAEPIAAKARPAVSLMEQQATAEPQPTQAQPTPETEAIIYASAVHSCDWDGEDERMLAKIAMAEAEGESVEGKALVILVVLNRVWSDEFPDSIEEVIFQKNQFSPVAEGGRYWTTEPDADCYEALELVRGGWDESQGALYFESTGKNGWHSQNLAFLFEFGGHRFYR